MPLGMEVGLGPGDIVHNYNPIIFVATLSSFQTLFSNRHFVLLSSLDFLAVIVFHGSYALHQFSESERESSRSLFIMLSPVHLSSVCL